MSNDRNISEPISRRRLASLAGPPSQKPDGDLRCRGLPLSKTR